MLGQIELGNYGVRDIEQEPEVVPLGRELPLCGQQLLEARHRGIPSGPRGPHRPSRASTLMRHEEIVHVVRRLSAPPGWLRTSR